MFKYVKNKIGAISLFKKKASSAFPEGLKLHPSSNIHPKKITMKPNCSLSIDADSQISGQVTFDKEGASASIGKRVFFSGHLVVAQQIEIGDDVLISWGVTIVDHNSHAIAFSQRALDVQDWRSKLKDWGSVKIAPVKICSKSWIGFNAIILKGVTVGEGAIVGAGSVVTKDVPPWTIVAGNPARIIRALDENER